MTSHALARLSVTTSTVALFALSSVPALANENVVGRSASGATISQSDRSNARSHQRILTSPTQLTESLRAMLRLPNRNVPGVELKAFGTGNHPYTSARASAADTKTPVDLAPWRATGKLFMKFGNNTFVCTASVIRKSLLVTAAHCVHNFGGGESGFADTVTFEPARHEGERPFGTWTAREWWIPKAYFDGTDKCSEAAPGIVCENDVAVVVMEKNDSDQFIGDVVGRYSVATDKVGDRQTNEDFGYTFFLNRKSAHMTQLGYPSANFDGTRMIRTDSLAVQDDPNNVVIGSNQTGGSSGGPWLQNFGTPMASFTGPVATDAEPNVVSAVTSWGFTSGDVKIQGASRFSKNTIYTTTSNIQSLVKSACDSNADAC